jgi:ABC-type nitrate/sulfonate/bicarbonate transport system substrate-binding protein
MKAEQYIERLRALPHPSPELRAYIELVTAYIRAGGWAMEASDEVWKGAIDRNQEAWDAVPETDKNRVYAFTR